VVFIPFMGRAQSKGNLVGEVLDKNTQKPLLGANIQIVNTNYTTLSDSLGKFSFKGIPTGQYHIVINYVGSIPYHLYNVIVGSGNINYITAELLPLETTLKEVVVGNVKKSVRAATLETPLSIQKLTSEEIKSSPGSNFDISKVVQTLPGVTGSATTGAGFRNDIIVRGGAPNENVFYLDGIEIPVINHFSTQGSAGGPQGILNVSFIDEVKLSSSAFDAKYDNALSSVFEFKQKKGNSEKIQGNFRLGATEVASTLEGPLSKSSKTTFLLSARRSYLQFLFNVLDLPIRPNYWDFQYKVSHQIDNKTTLTFLGIGAIDKFYYVAPKNSTPEKRFALNVAPSINQWSYTVGASLKKLINKGYWNMSISRSHLNNVNEKYEDNLNPIKGEKTFDYTSNDISNNIRFDITKSFLGLKWTTGANLQFIEYDNATYQLLPKPYIDSALYPFYLPAPNYYQYATNLNYRKYGAFFQIGKRAFNNRLGISAGIRTDGNGFNTAGRAFYNRLSPRIGLSFVLTDKINL
ncbi:TonB-dependent receptor, partial [archaeon]|nr:TonB-dependent receptor [archaeon]